MSSAISGSSASAPSAVGSLGRVAIFAFTATLLATAAWVWVTAQREIRADFSSGQARLTFQRWAEGVSAPASRAQWEVALNELKEAAEIDPSDPALQESLGNGWMVGTVQAWATEQDRILWAGHAKQHFIKATELRPRDALTWALLANAMTGTGEFGPAMKAAERAVQLGPHEGHVHDAVLALVFEFWDQSSEELQQWAFRLFENGTQAQRDAINRVGGQFGTKLESDTPPRSAK